MLPELYRAATHRRSPLGPWCRPLGNGAQAVQAQEPVAGQQVMFLPCATPRKSATSPGVICEPARPVPVLVTPL